MSRAVERAVEHCWDGKQAPSMGARPRDVVRSAVFRRDDFTCVFCGNDAVDAHHLLERRLWKDGGYHLDNLISVCADCHLLCEHTVYSVEAGRSAAGITTVLVPEHLYADQPYDKWGNPILEDGMRLVGELFDDPSVQQVLVESGAIDLFVPYMKYPRTYHLPWSHPNRDDRTLDSLEHFKGKDVVVTEKLDGECTSLYTDFLHARAVDGRPHPSQGWVRNFHGKMGHDIPVGWRVCGENVYARHSIKYDDLDTYFYGFSLWDRTTCANWDDTLEWFELLGVTPVPVLYEGLFEGCDFRGLGYDTNLRGREGYVVRLREAFSYRHFGTSVAKYVRPNHLQTPARWDGAFEKNGLRA